VSSWQRQRSGFRTKRVALEPAALQFTNLVNGHRCEAVALDLEALQVLGKPLRATRSIEERSVLFVAAWPSIDQIDDEECNAANENKKGEHQDDDENLKRAEIEECKHDSLPEFILVFQQAVKVPLDTFTQHETMVAGELAGVIARPQNQAICLRYYDQLFVLFMLSHACLNGECT